MAGAPRNAGGTESVAWHGRTCRNEEAGSADILNETTTKVVGDDGFPKNILMCFLECLEEGEENFPGMKPLVSSLIPTFVEHSRLSFPYPRRHSHFLSFTSVWKEMMRQLLDSLLNLICGKLHINP